MTSETRAAKLIAEWRATAVDVLNLDARRWLRLCADELEDALATVPPQPASNADVDAAVTLIHQWMDAWIAESLDPFAKVRAGEVFKLTMRVFTALQAQPASVGPEVLRCQECSAAQTVERRCWRCAATLTHASTVRVPAPAASVEEQPGQLTQKIAGPHIAAIIDIIARDDFNPDHATDIGNEVRAAVDAALQRARETGAEK
jgi:hypothetical protein